MYMTYATEKNGDLIHYAIRDIPSGKYYRHPKKDVSAEKLELVSGINRAATWVQSDDGEPRTARYVICHHKLKNCQIVACYEHENYKKGRLYNREIKGVVS